MPLVPGCFGELFNGCIAQKTDLAQLKNREKWVIVE
jgi:hypothetical protein